MLPWLNKSLILIWYNSYQKVDVLPSKLLSKMDSPTRARANGYWRKGNRHKWFRKIWLQTQMITDTNSYRPIYGYNPKVYRQKQVGDRMVTDTNGIQTWQNRMQPLLSDQTVAKLNCYQLPNLVFVTVSKFNVVQIQLDMLVV